jgi:hypothetical protein
LFNRADDSAPGFPTLAQAPVSSPERRINQDERRVVIVLCSSPRDARVITKYDRALRIIQGSSSP